MNKKIRSKLVNEAIDYLDWYQDMDFNTKDEMI